MSRNILVVDDETQIRDLLAIYLKRQGFQVTTAGTSDETFALLARQPLDLVVLDISLGGEDGLSLLAKIKASHPATKVIMLTGMGFVEDLLQEAHQKGADGYVSKVLPLDELLLTIQRILRGSEIRAAAC
jgi:DNA-binding response OmpR family regulator